MSKIIEMVSNLVEPIILNQGMELVEVEFKKLYGQDTLIIYIDKEGGVDLNDCEKIHNLIDGPLDTLDPTNGQTYNLNVSSPGLDRPLKTLRDYDKKIGQDVEVSLFKPIDKLKKFEAKLISHDIATCDVEYKGKTIKLNKKDIAVIRPAIKF